MGFWSRLFGKRQPEITSEAPPGTGWRLWIHVSEDDMLMLYTADQVETWHPDHGAEMVNPLRRRPGTRNNDAKLWWRPVP